MASYDDLPDGWDIAGWRDGPDWQNTEEGAPFPDDHDLAMTDQITVSRLDDKGNLEYFSIMGGVDGYDGLMDAIADLDDEY
jgi:hypothetical protein